MRVFVSGRRGGKTAACLEWLIGGGRAIDVGGGKKRWNRVVVCADEASAEWLRRRLEQMTRGWEELEREDLLLVRDAILGVGHARARLRGTRGLEVAVDNADILLQYMVGAPVDLATLTGEIQS